MTYFNPLIAPVAGSAQALRAAADKERQVARAQALAKNAAAEGDRFEHQVESADALKPASDDGSNGGQPRRQPKRKDDGQGQVNADAPEDPPHLDVTG